MIDNEDLKLINLDPWDIPKLYRDRQVAWILAKLKEMQPGEARKVEGVKRERVRLLRSAVWRQIKRHDLDGKVVVRRWEIYLEK